MEPVGAVIMGKQIVEQVQKYKKYFQPFKPGIRSLILNYTDGSARIDLSLYVPVKGRTGKKVQVPISENFRVIGMYDSEFNSVDRVWKRTDAGWLLKAKELPKTSEHFLLSMQGSVSTSGLQQFVEVTVPASPFLGKEEDKYWLHCALRSPDALQAIYQSLEIDKVNVNAKVTVNRCFSTSIPHKLRVALEAKSNLLKAISSGDRNLRRKAEHRYRIVHKVTTASEVDILKLMADLISEEHFEGFVQASDPYQIGGIAHVPRRANPIPSSIEVETFTSLNYSQKVAKGDLVFARERYKEVIQERMEKLV